MTGKHTIFDTRRVGVQDSRDISPAPSRPDSQGLRSSFLADRGVKEPREKELASAALVLVGEG